MINRNYKSIEVNGVRFLYAENFNQSKELVSLSFTFNYQLSTIIKFTGNYEDCFSEFKDFVEGKVFGGLMVEPHQPIPGVYCYLMTDGYLYKIGKSKDPLDRLKAIRTGNPTIKLLSQSLFVSESYLHLLFHEKNHSLEWFELNEVEASMIKSLMRLNSQEKVNMVMRMTGKEVRKIKRQKHIEKSDKKEIYSSYSQKIPFGKYRGKRLSEMITNDGIGYLKWCQTNLERSNPFLRHIKVVLDNL